MTVVLIFGLKNFRMRNVCDGFMRCGNYLQALVAMAASAATAAVVGVEMYWVGKILNRSKLFYRNVTRLSR